MEAFPGNTNKDKDNLKQPPKKVGKPKPKIEKVISSEPKILKKGFGTRFKETFFGGEFSQARSYIVTDVMLPALKNLIVDATSKGVERLIYGETTRRRIQDPNRPRMMYNSVNPSSRYAPRSGPMLPDQPPLPSKSRSGQQVVLPIREEAETVVERLTDLIDAYDVATVADLYDMVGYPTTYVDNKWGWTALPYADVKQIREGYLIDLPPAEPI